jgi:hypothetical protein
MIGLLQCTPYEGPHIVCCKPVQEWGTSRRGFRTLIISLISTRFDDVFPQTTLKMMFKSVKIVASLP